MLVQNSGSLRVPALQRHAINRSDPRERTRSRSDSRTTSLLVGTGRKFAIETQLESTECGGACLNLELYGRTVYHCRAMRFFFRAAGIPMLSNAGTGVQQAECHGFPCQNAYRKS